MQILYFLMIWLKLWSILSGGYYLLTSASVRNVNQTARIESHPVTPNGQAQCLTFWYFWCFGVLWYSQNCVLWILWTHHFETLFEILTSLRSFFFWDNLTVFSCWSGNLNQFRAPSHVDWYIFNVLAWKYMHYVNFCTDTDYQKPNENLLRSIPNSLVTNVNDTV